MDKIERGHEMGDDQCESGDGFRANATQGERNVTKLTKRLKRKPVVPVHDNPREELRRLIKEHRALTRTSVALHHMASDRTNLETGEKIPCLLPLDRREALLAESEAMSLAASRLKTPIRQQLRQLPIYTHFLLRVYGCGEIVAGYIAAEVDIHRSTKPSSLRQFMGLAVIDGRLSHRTKGKVNNYNGELRTRLYQMFGSMMKVGRRDGNTSKYLKVWDDYRHRAAHMAEPEKPGKALSKGRWKAADVFAEDLYIIWRAIEGLPVWPSYYAAKLGYEHGGKISVNAPRMLTLVEALELVGNVGAVPAATVPDVDPDDLVALEAEAAE